MQVEPDFNGLRNGYSDVSWIYQNDPTQMCQEGDSLPEKIYSMVSKLVDEDNDFEPEALSSFPTKKVGFYDGTQNWSDVPILNKSALNGCANSQFNEGNRNMLYPGVEEIDVSQNILDLSFLNSTENLHHANSKLGENLDSGFASPADKSGSAVGSTASSHDDFTGFPPWDWGHLSNSLGTDSNQNYLKILAENPEILQQIAHGDSTVDGIFNESNLFSLDMLPPTDDSHSPCVSSQETQNDELGLFPLSSFSNMLISSDDCMKNSLSNVNSPTQPPQQLMPSSIAGSRNNSLNSSIGSLKQQNSPYHVGSMETGQPPSSQVIPVHSSPLDNFSPFRPPPDLPFHSFQGPLGYNNNNEYRHYPGEHPRNGFNMPLPHCDVQGMFANGFGEHDGRALMGEWPSGKATNPYGAGLLPMGNGMAHPGAPMPRFGPSGAFRSPPPFLPPLYPPSLDPSEVYPVPFFQRHLFPFPAPLYNFRQIRRNPTRDELSARLDQCYEQFRLLEKERKKTEAELARNNPGKKLSSANSMTVPRLPPNPTRVDRLVVDQLREHARVVTLVSKMERLRGNPFGSDVHATLSAWEEAVRKVQMLRQEEIRLRSRIALEPAEHRLHQETKGIHGLAISIHELSVASRRARTALWACLIVTLHMPSTNSSTPIDSALISREGSLGGSK